MVPVLMHPGNQCAWQVLDTRSPDETSWLNVTPEIADDAGPRCPAVCRLCRLCRCCRCSAPGSVLVLPTNLSVFSQERSSVVLPRVPCLWSCWSLDASLRLLSLTWMRGLMFGTNARLDQCRALTKASLQGRSSKQGVEEQRVLPVSPSTGYTSIREVEHGRGLTWLACSMQVA